MNVSQQDAAIYDLSGRTDEHRIIEEVAAINSKPTTKNESRLIEIDDELDSALEDLAAVFKEHGKRLSSGVDPELLQAGLTLAGYHIEKGARSFAAYAKAITEDMGDMVKPYLKSWYLGAKFDPRAANFDGMSSAAEVESADIETILNEGQQTKGKANELPKLDSTSTKPLEGVSSNNVQGTGSQRPTTGEARGSGGTNLSGNERTGGAGLSTTRIMGDGTGEISDSTRGEGAERLAATPAQELATDFVTQDEGQYRWWWPQTVDESLQSALAVQTTESEMTPQLHNLLMESKLRRLVQEDETPRETMMMSWESHPEMYQIGIDTEVRNYPSAIMWSDSMGALMSKIIWSLETTEIQEEQQETIQESVEEQSLMSILEKM